MDQAPDSTPVSPPVPGPAPSARGVFVWTGVGWVKGQKEGLWWGGCSPGQFVSWWGEVWVVEWGWDGRWRSGPGPVGAVRVVDGQRWPR